MCFWCEMKKFLLLSARDDGVFTVETVGLAGGGGGWGLISRLDPVGMAG